MDKHLNQWPLAQFGMFGWIPCTYVTRPKGRYSAGAHGLAFGLHTQLARISEYVLQHAPQRAIANMEYTRMEVADPAEYDKVFRTAPVLLSSRHWAPLTRPRLWWHSQEPSLPPGAVERRREGNNVRELDLGDVHRQPAKKFLARFCLYIALLQHFCAFADTSQRRARHRTRKDSSLVI